MGDIEAETVQPPQKKAKTPQDADTVGIIDSLASRKALIEANRIKAIARKREVAEAKLKGEGEKKGGKDWMITCTQRATQKS